ncbi:MAG: ABC transporter ATP-binding protein [Cytophagales bacterium]|nr:ABC transporter ATP-binding protein [Cytophagales bacterium]
MALLSVKNLYKKYRGKDDYALQNVSFELEEGQLLSIIGESGCGKTTLMRILAGLEEKTKGNAYLNGERIRGPLSKLVAGHDEIEIVQQDFDLFPNHKVRDIIQFKLRAYNEEYQDQRINELLELCNLKNVEYKTPKELSGGQEQRVALAQALADEPKLILMDEPFSHLDIVLKRQLKSEIVEIIAKTNTAFIFVTHDTQDALSISDYIAIIHNGNLIQWGNPIEIYEIPANPYVASFFGTPSIFNLQDLAKITDKFPNQNQQACLRAEHIHIEENGELEGIVKACYYQGHQYEIIISIHGIEFTTFYPSVILSNQKTNFSIDWEKIYLFKN